MLSILLMQQLFQKTSAPIKKKNNFAVTHLAFLLSAGVSFQTKKLGQCLAVRTAANLGRYHNEMPSMNCRRGSKLLRLLLCMHKMNPAVHKRTAERRDYEFLLLLHRYRAGDYNDLNLSRSHLYLYMILYFLSLVYVLSLGRLLSFLM